MRYRVSLALLAIATAAACSLIPAALGQAHWFEHPGTRLVGMALETAKTLGLSEEQVLQLRSVWARLKENQNEFSETSAHLERRHHELRSAGDEAQRAREEIRHKHGQLVSARQALMEEAQEIVARVLTGDQRARLEGLIEEQARRHAARRLTLESIMQSRERLRLTPRQFTQLQYLQSDFLREFAPIRERMELLRMQFRSEFGDTQAPGVERERFHARMEELERAAGRLQQIFGERASEVLTAEQRESLRREP